MSNTETAAPFDAPVTGIGRETQLGTLWRHKKTGGVYVIISICFIEATLEKGVLYHSVGGHGPLWCRPMSEFTDGRFAPVELNVSAEGTSHE